MTKNTETPQLPEEAIAIIGLAGRFPGAASPEELWRNLLGGVESIRHFTDAELKDDFPREVRDAPNFVRARAVLERIEDFDAAFFGMYPKEAALTDPQQRLFLECCWEALEDAGYDPARYPGPISVVAGCSPSSYFMRNVAADPAVVREFTSNYQVGMYPMLVGAGQDFLATRVSYKLDLRGPSMTVQAACATSLLAIAQACETLLLYQADMALAGGVSITLPQERGYLHQEGGMVSEDGSCRTFDARASGTVFGSGCGAILLKRLEDAVADGDHVYAVIRGHGIANDGAGRVGFTAPSVEGQVAAIEMALAAAGVDARSIGYVECHGTATPLGDPIEITALTRAFRATTDDRQFCAVGSVKTNVGHLDAAAGVTGVIKTALSLAHGELPASLHYTAPNPHIDFESSPFFVNAVRRPWHSEGEPLRAGVSAFGVGGTNVHLVLEEAPPAARRAVAAATPGPELLVLSARSREAVDKARERLAGFIASHPDVALADIAHTLRIGRRAFDVRYACVAADAAEAVRELKSPAASSQPVRGKPRIVFMFPGQGAQYPQMGAGLYRSSPTFRSAVDRCCDLLMPLLGVDLRTILYAEGDGADLASRLQATGLAQPAIFTLEYALAEWWRGLGVIPDLMVGHSVGEFVAATVAGTMTLEEAVRLVALRGRLMQELPGGAMLAVRLPVAEVEPLLPPGASLAAVNGPALVVVAGPFEIIAEFEAQLAARGAVTRRLHTSHAFHSAMVEPIVAPLAAELARIQLRQPAIPFVSCVTGELITLAEATSPEYWARHARLPVRFADAIATAATQGPVVLLEVGPGTTLTTLARQCVGDRIVGAISTLPSAERERGDREASLDALGRLWRAGVEPLWSAAFPDASRVPLPTYPFERSRHWIDEPVHPAALGGAIPAAASDTFPQAPAEALPQAPHDMEEIPPMPTPSQSTAVNPVSEAILGLLEDLSGARPNEEESRATFIEMGFDSLFLSQVAQRIQGKYKTKITFRQLLGDLSTVAALTDFLCANSAVAAAMATATAPVAAKAAPAGAPVQPAPSPRSASVPASGAAPADGVEALLREQLAMMSQVFNRQLELLGAAGQAPAAAAPAAVPAASMAVTATVAPAMPAAPAAPAAPAKALPSRFETYSPTKRSVGTGIGERERAHIDSLIDRYTRRTAGSKARTQAARDYLADPRAAAGFRTEWKEMVYPIVSERAKGSKIWDVDGNEYVDLVNGFGQTMFGHAPDFVVEAVSRQLTRDFSIGPQSELTGPVAERLAQITGHERVTFCNTGSEAVMAAMRLSRSVTGRDKIVVFNGDYHGQFDEVLVKGVAGPRTVPIATGIPQTSVDQMVVLDYGTDESLAWIEANADDLAGVLVEAVQSRRPQFFPIEFLRRLRQVTQDHGVALIMDEVVTGFRVHPAGIQGLTGIRGDLATYGKVVGGGLPIGVLAGSKAFMDALDGGTWRYGDESFPESGVTFFAGTFVRHPLALAAAASVLDHLAEAGPALQENLTATTLGLVESLRALFAEYRLAAEIGTRASFFYFSLHEDPPLSTLLFYHLRLRGVMIQEGFPCFLTTTHSAADVAHIVEAFRQALSELSEAGILPERTTSEVESLQVPVEPGTSLALTESQMEIWLAAQFGEDASCAFNESVTLHLDGELDPAVVQRTLDLLVRRHDALRLQFAPTGDAMVVGPATAVELQVVDLSAADAPDAALAALIAREAREPFDLVVGSPVRFQLVRLAPRRHALLLTAHHIVCDGWSINVLAGEFSTAYQAIAAMADPTLPVPMSFARYALAKASRDRSHDADTEAYWLAQFADPVAPLDLPTDRPRAALRSFNGASRTRFVGRELYQALKKAGARQTVTLFGTLLGGFEVLLARLSGQTDIVVAVPAAAQSQFDDAVLVGHCVNLLPLRARVDLAATVAEQLKSAGQRVLDAFEHQDYTYGTLVKRLSAPRESNRMPLTEVQFNLERLASGDAAGKLRLSMEPNAKAFVAFDIFLNIGESDAGLRLDCDYNTDLFDAATIDRWLESYEAILRGVATSPDRPVGDLDVLTAAEQAALDRQASRDARSYPHDRGIHELVADQAKRRSGHVAVRADGRSLTYSELDARANQLAHVIRGGLRDDGDRQPMVAVCVQRSADMLVALIACHKAGAAYVPLDPTHPEARLQETLRDARVDVLLVDEDGFGQRIAPDTARVSLRGDAAAISAAPTSAPAVAHRADALAYVIYTSGSTGVPKGVAVPHRAVVNLLASMAERPGLGEDDVLVAVTTVAFDIAALELFLPLIVGGTVVIADAETTHDGFRLLALLQSSRATVMQATPAGWRILLEAGFKPSASLKMLCGGEALPLELAAQLGGGAGELWNMYGPTETTIWSSCGRVTGQERVVSVGQPIANTQFYVLDAQQRPAACGVIGELYIGGDGVAAGYHRRPELTAERFVTVPSLPGRLYRTGDRARWLANGEVQVLGRLDFQVKLRGFRIELGEIEAVLAGAEGVAAAVVVLRDGAPHSQLVAYVVPHGGRQLDPEALREHLAQRLPEYMLPSAFVMLERLPVSANGKLDRNALPAPRASVATQAQVSAPATATETALAKVWVEVLQAAQIGRESDLLKLGADSLQIFQIAARATRAGLPVTARQLLQSRTLSAAASVIDAASAAPGAAAPAALPSLSQFKRPRRAEESRT